MARKEDADVDPRFDPVFQRGYDPAQHRTRVRPPVETPARESAPTRPETFAPAPDRAPSGDSALDERRPAELDDEPLRRNPFRLILLLTSVAAIGGAALLLWKRVAEDPYGGYGGVGGDVAHVFFQQFVAALLGPLLTGGLLGLCLWLALGALRRRDHG